MRLKTVFFVSILVCFSFVAGLAAVVLDFYPYQVMQEAQSALTAIKQGIVANYWDGVSMPAVDVTRPTARQLKETGHDELILVSGGQGYHSEIHPDGCIAWLMDREGTVKHTWRFDRNLWVDLKEVSLIPGVSNWRVVDVHVYPNGDLLANFQCWQCWPYGGGLAKYDKDSKLLWKKNYQTHHWLSFDDDGHIYVPSGKTVFPPLALGDTKGRITYPRQINTDVVMILDEQGNLLDEISMLDALTDSGWQGLIWDRIPDRVSTDVVSNDPLHLNDVRVVTRAVADRVSWLNVGDLLVSFRNLNAIGVLDIQTRKFKWMVSGCFVRQHSPRFFEDGVLVFDNLGGVADWGGSQLVYVDFEQQLPQRMFPTAADQIPSTCCSEVAGYVDLHRDQSRRVLMTLPQQGRVWEVDLDQNQVLWEYLHAVPDTEGDGPGKAKFIYAAKYIYEISFPFNNGEST